MPHTHRLNANAGKGPAIAFMNAQRAATKELPHDERRRRIFEALNDKLGKEVLPLKSKRLLVRLRRGAARKLGLL